jgi:hypothetical protein
MICAYLEGKKQQQQEMSTQSIMCDWGALQCLCVPLVDAAADSVNEALSLCTPHQLGLGLGVFPLQYILSAMRGCWGRLGTHPHSRLVDADSTTELLLLQYS